MIKKLLLSAAFAVLAAGAASADVKIGATSYETLQAAVNAAQDNDVITIDADIELSKVVDFSALTTKSTITIEGVGDVTIKHGSYEGMMFLLRANRGVNVKNIKFAGNGSTRTAIENKNNGSTLNVENCTFDNFAGMAIQNTKEAIIKNVEMTNCTSSNNVFVGSNNTTLAGKANYTLYMENYSLKQQADLNGKVTVSLKSYDAGKVVVSNCTTPDVFVLSADAPEDFKLGMNGNNLVLIYEKKIVKNETTGVEYTSVKDAFDAAATGDVLVVLENAEVSGRLLGELRSITVKGATPDIVLTRTDRNKNNLWIEAKQGVITLENLILDCNNIDIVKPVLTVHNNGGSGMVLNNIVIRNGKSTVGLLTNGAGRSIKLNNVTAENTAEGTPGIVLGGILELNGNNNIPVVVSENATIAVPEGGALTNEQPIMLTLPEGTEAGKTVVSGTVDYRKFALTNEGLYLKPDFENKAVVTSNEVYTGINDVVVDENAPVEYYNLQGVRVANPEAGQLYIRRQGGKATKVLVK